MHWTADMCMCEQEYAAQTKHAKEETSSVQQALNAATVRARTQSDITCHVCSLGSLLDSRICGKRCVNVVEIAATSCCRSLSRRVCI